MKADERAGLKACMQCLYVKAWKRSGVLYCVVVLWMRRKEKVDISRIEEVHDGFILEKTASRVLVESWGSFGYASTE